MAVEKSVPPKKTSPPDGANTRTLKAPSGRLLTLKVPSIPVIAEPAVMKLFAPSTLTEAPLTAAPAAVTVPVMRLVGSAMSTFARVRPPSPRVTMVARNRSVPLGW